MRDKEPTNYQDFVCLSNTLLMRKKNRDIYNMLFISLEKKHDIIFTNQLRHKIKS